MLPLERPESCWLTSNPVSLSPVAAEVAFAIERRSAFYAGRTLPGRTLRRPGCRFEFLLVSLDCGRTGDLVALGHQPGDVGKRLGNVVGLAVRLRLGLLAQRDREKHVAVVGGQFLGHVGPEESGVSVG